MFFIQSKNGSIHKNRKCLSWSRENNIFSGPKVTKMGSIIGHRIDFNGGRIDLNGLLGDIRYVIALLKVPK